MKVKTVILNLILVFFLVSCFKQKENGGTTSVGQPITAPPPQSLNCKILFEVNLRQQISDQDLFFDNQETKKFCKIDQALILFETIVKKYQPTPLAVQYFLNSSNATNPSTKKTSEEVYCQSLGGEVLLDLQNSNRICIFSDDSAIATKTLLEGPSVHKVLASYLLKIY